MSLSSYLYNNVTYVCIFIVVDRDLLKDTHRWRQIHVSRLVFLFSCLKNLSINHLNFYCIEQIDNIFPCVYCNRSQKTSQRVKNKSRHSTSSRVVLFYSLHAVRSSVIYYSTHKQENVCMYMYRVCVCMYV